MADEKNTPKAAPAPAPESPELIGKLREAYGKDVKILSAGPNTVVITFTEVTKGEDGRDHSATVTRKVPRP